MGVDTEQKDLKYYAELPYTIIIERYDDAEKPYWVARILELPHCLIHGDTPEEAVREIEEVKLEWIQSNLEDGLPIPEPHKYSGQFHLRIPPSLHKSMAQLAEIYHISLNHYLNVLLSRAVGVEEGIEIMQHTLMPKYRDIDTDAGEAVQKILLNLVADATRKGKLEIVKGKIGKSGEVELEDREITHK